MRFLAYQQYRLFSDFPSPGEVGFTYDADGRPVRTGRSLGVTEAGGFVVHVERLDGPYKEEAFAWPR